jgi:putative glutathione S-transferase
VTVPAIIDTPTGDVVTNDYPQITLDFSTEWIEFHRPNAPQLIPADRAEMDELIEDIYRDVNNGVYRCGFATTQEAYEAAYDALFARLDVLEERLADRAYLLGDTLREVDIRLFTTLVRFDAVYHGHFKCNRQKLTEFPNLWAYARRLYQLPSFGETVDFDQIKRHYYVTHDTINPTGIVPKGPDPRVWTA